MSSGIFRKKPEEFASDPRATKISLHDALHRVPVLVALVLISVEAHLAVVPDRHALRVVFIIGSHLDVVAVDRSTTIAPLPCKW